MAVGPLDQIRIVEIAGLGPTPFAAMLLADMGAEVIRVERPDARSLLGLDYDILDRGRGFVAADLKDANDLARVRRLIESADGLIEGMRPGVMERLGLGPDSFAETNPRLVYGRMTGWGQTGPLAHAAGHDINYIALSGALHAIGTADQPLPPLNLLGDFGGGGMYLAFGMVCALLEATRSGIGQVVDAAIVDGTAHLMAMIYAMQGAGLWSDRRGDNLLDGAAHFYGTYVCKCGGFVAIGSIEPQFYALLVEKTGVDANKFRSQLDRRKWPELRALLAEAFAARTRDEWCAIMEGSDVCFAPVLSIAEAPEHPHNRARGIFIEDGGVRQPAPAPRLSRTPGAVQPASQTEALDIEAVLSAWSGQKGN
ncbi:MAG: CoA transferase [Rhodobacteraceae bacterium]|nr:CoA transferase [Paracoccaceae bacterium]